MTIFTQFTLLVSFFVISGCTGLPKNVKPIENFNLDQYLGTWYEMARLDHRFERGMNQVTANYSKRDDGGVRVLNKGFDTKKQQWKTAEGKAYFVQDDSTGHLKVSFFGPFYGSYVIFELDPKYQYAFVAGNSHDYLWLLSRNKQISSDLKTRFLNSVQEKGFNTEKIIWVDQPLE